MNHCVPDRDGFLTAKSAVEALEPVAKAHRNYLSSDCPNFGENDFSELIWTTDGNLGVMQVAGTKNSHWVSSGLWSRQNEDRLAPSNTSSGSDQVKDGTLDAVVISAVRSETVACSNEEEDELISWLQYPDDTLDKNNCSDIFSPPATCRQPPIPREFPQQGSGAPAAAMPRLSHSDSLAGGIAATAVSVTDPVPSRQSQHIEASAMLPPRPKRTSALNFSHFSRPAAIAKASLSTLGKCSASISNHLQQQFKKNDTAMVVATTVSSGVVEGSTGSAATQTSAVANKEQEHNSEVQQSQSQTSLPSLRSCSSRKEAATSRKEIPPTSSAGADGTEQTLTSSSGGSGPSRELKRSYAKKKRKGKNAADSIEYQSEDVEGESVDVVKKPAPSRTGSKRSRAAEVHNLSERRRRDRINEKMKALQELIPNSNKTDKASMLDEAIEYLKMLQLQLQMMSMRTGLSLPPMIIPAGMQHLQMPQMGMGVGVGMGLGMGIGMGMGMGVGLMDPACRPVMLPNAAPPSTAMPVNMNMDMYHTCMLQQQLQQQQLQLRQQIQQQQQQQIQHQHLQQQQQQHIQNVTSGGRQ